jgi:phasin family protein
MTSRQSRPHSRDPISSRKPKEQPMTASTEPMEKAAQGMMQMYEEANDFARNSMEAMLRSAAAMTKGWDETARSTGGLLQESLARVVSAGKTIMSAKNPREMMDMQTEFMKDCFDCWMSGTGKLSEISSRAAKEAIEPVAQHTNNAVVKFAQKAKAAA